MTSLTLYRARRRGLTLLELVVVVAILAALAGILVPLLGNLLFSAHTASGVTNIVEVEKLVQTYASIPGGDRCPNLLDNIVDQTEGKDLMSYVKTNSSATTPDITKVPLTLTLAHVTSLNAAGITKVAQLTEKPTPLGNWSPTLFPYGDGTVSTPAFIDLATGMKVAQLAATVAARKFAAPAAGTYAVFGLGKYNSMAPKYIQEAPVWYNPNANSDPNTVYSRFGLVFRVDGSTASFIGAVELSTMGAMARDDNLGFNYSTK